MGPGTDSNAKPKGIGPLHADNGFQNKARAGIAVGNGFGKLMGSTQIQKLGEIETPVVLTNTLNTPPAG